MGTELNHVFVHGIMYSCIANRVKKLNLYFAFNIQPIRASESCLLANFIPSSFSLKQFMKEVGISSYLAVVHTNVCASLVMSESDMRSIIDQRKYVVYDNI